MRTGPLCNATQAAGTPKLSFDLIQAGRHPAEWSEVTVQSARLLKLSPLSYKVPSSPMRSASCGLLGGQTEGALAGSQRAHGVLRSASRGASCGARRRCPSTGGSSRRQRSQPPPGLEQPEGSSRGSGAHLDAAAPKETHRERRRMAPLSGEPSTVRASPSLAGSGSASSTAPASALAASRLHAAELSEAAELSSEQAALLLQRWWRRCLESRANLFENLVVELMELRAGAAVEVQLAWRSYVEAKRQREESRTHNGSV